MKKYISVAVALGMIMMAVTSCKTVKQINKAIAPKDSTVAIIFDKTKADSLLMIQKTIENLNRNYIDFKTFSAKIDRKSTRLNSSHAELSRMPSSA